MIWIVRGKNDGHPKKYSSIVLHLVKIELCIQLLHSKSNNNNKYATSFR